MKSLIAAVACLALVACDDQPPHWNKSGAAGTDLNADMNRCVHEIAATTGRLDMASCLSAHGWYLTP